MFQHDVVAFKKFNFTFLCFCDFQVIKLPSDDEPHPEKYTIPLDVILSFPMFLRIYLFCRVLTLHRYSKTGVVF